MDQRTTELALLAGASYESSRERNLGNRIPFPAGWTRLAGDPIGGSGFEAVAFTNGTEIVISYAGTNFSEKKDLKADAILGLGFTDQQLLDAAVFYEKIKRDFAGGSGNGVEFFAIGFWLAVSTGLAPIGFVLFEASRLLSFERWYREQRQ